MKRLLLPVLLLLVSVGCAERWVRPGTSEAEADATNAACGDRSELAVPAQMVWTLVESGGYDRDRRCFRSRDGREHCEVFTRYRPPRYGWVDANRGPRDAWRRECMRAQGFSFEGYRPLRLE